MTESRALMILVAGPYRSGTGDDSVKMAENVRLMERYALPRARRASATRRSTRSSIRSRSGWSKTARACSGSAARHKAPISWCALPSIAGSPSTTR
jgi:hypothetical protein